MSLGRDLPSECEVIRNPEMRFCPRDAEAAEDLIWLTNPSKEDQSRDSSMSVTSQCRDSSYSSNSESPEEPLDPEDKSGTEHTELPWENDPARHHWRDLICETETWPRKDEAVVEIAEVALGAQDGSAARGTELPQVQDPAGHRQGEAASLLEQSEPCPRDGIGEEPQDCQDGSATGLTHRKTRRGFLAPVEGMTSNPKVILMLILLLLVLTLLVSLAVVSAKSCGETSVTPVSAVTCVVLACPHGWVGHRGICYFLSRDQLSWDQAQAWCSELGASLAVLQDWEMEFLFRLTRNEDHWLGLRRRGRELQWGDGSSFSSLVEVLGNAECVFLGEDNLKSEICSNEMPFICSRPQTHR